MAAAGSGQGGRTPTIALVVQQSLAGLERSSPASAWIEGRRTPASRRSAHYALRTIVRLIGGDPAHPERVDWTMLTRDHVRRFRDELVRRYRPGTGETYLAGLFAILHEAVVSGQISHDRYEQITNVKPVGGKSAPRGRLIRRDETSALLKATGRLHRSWRGVPKEERAWRAARDTAIVSLIARTGIRKGELCTLRLDDYSPASRLLRIHGKGRVERQVRIGPKARAHLAAWLEIRGLRPGPLFMNFDRSPLGRTTVWNMLRSRSRQAGVSKFAPHDFRRTFGTTLLRNGVDPFLVQRAMGHACITSTRKYDLRTDDEAWDAVEALDAQLPG